MRTSDISVGEMDIITGWFIEFITNHINSYLDTVIPERILPSYCSSKWRLSHRIVREMLMDRNNGKQFIGQKEYDGYDGRPVKYSLGTNGMKHYYKQDDLEPFTSEHTIECGVMDIYVYINAYMVHSTSPIRRYHSGYDIIIGITPHTNELHEYLIATYPEIFDKPVDDQVHRDLLGHEIFVGDSVAFSNGTSRLYEGRVTRLTRKGIKVECKELGEKQINDLNNRVVRVG